MVNEPPIRLHPVGSRPGGLPIVLLALAGGVVAGLWLGRVTPAGPTAIATAEASATEEASATASSTNQARWIVNASVAPDLMQAYYFTRVTGSGLEPVVCTTGTVLACQPVAALDIVRASPAPEPIPGPNDLWPQLTPVHLDRAGAAADVIAVDDLSPALFSQIVIQVLGPGQSWTNGGASVTPVSVNGAVAVMDLRFLGVGRYVVLIRSVYSVPPDRYGLVEAWKAIGIEVDG